MPDLESLTDPIEEVDNNPSIGVIGSLNVTAVSEAPSYLNLLLYGEPGVGKTVLAGSADEIAEMSPVLVMDIEGGSYSLRAFHPGVHVVRCKSMGDVVEVYNHLQRGDHPYKTVVVDSLTEVQKLIMGQIMADVVREDPDRDPDVPSIREWGKSGEQVRRVVRRFRDLPMNTIFTALVDSDKNDKTGKITFWPSLPGKLRREVPGYVDIVLYVYKVKVKDNDVEENKIAVLASSTDTHICKDRSNQLDPVTLDPTMQKLYTRIKEGNN